MKQRFNRALSLALAVCMVLVMIPASAVAAEP